MFKNMKISAKLIACFAIVVVLASVSGILGTVLLIKSDNDYSVALVTNGFAQGQIGQFNTAVTKGGAVVRDLIMLTNPADLKASQAELAAIQTQASASLEELRVNCTSPKELELLAVIDKKLPEYRALRDQVIALGLENKNSQALDQFHSAARPVLNEIIAAGDALTELNVALGNEVSTTLSAQNRTAIILIIAIIVVAMAISIAFAVFVARSIARPIIRVKDAAAQLAQGNLNISITADSADEVGEMTNSFSVAASTIQRYISEITRGLSLIANGDFNINSNETFIGDFKQIEQSIDAIANSLSDTLGQINQASDQVSSGSDQVSSGAQALSQGATEQASSVEELAATITEISEQVKENALNARSASEKSLLSGQEVTQSNHKMQELITAMGNISHSSQEIGKVIKTIEDIAFQTNILALNAAVEAARAGAAGKGFAVVADEVRNLASKSAEAAKGTTVLIEGAIQAVSTGTHLVDDTAKSLLSVVAGSEEITDIINKISSASAEQSQSIAQVVTGVDQISSVVQTNSATAEESAAASEELSGQAQMLKQLVGKFILKRSRGSAPAVSASPEYHQQETTPASYYPPQIPHSTGKY